MLRKLLALWLCCVTAALQMPAQQVSQFGTKESDSRVISTSGNTVTFLDAGGTLTHNFELVVTGAPATLACTVNGVLPGGTTTALATSSGTGNQPLNFPGGPYSSYTVTCTWTGGTSPTVTINRLDTTGQMSYPPFNGPVLDTTLDCAGATLDVRLTTCINRLAGKCGVLDSRREGNQTLAASVVFAYSCVEWLPPRGTTTLPLNVSISGNTLVNQITIWCELVSACKFDSTGNGSANTLVFPGSNITIHGVKILAGRIAVQAGSEILLGTPGTPSYGDIIEDNWIVNAGAGAIITREMETSSIRRNIIEQPQGPGIQPQCGHDIMVEDNWIYDAEIGKFAGSGDMDIICTGSVYGQSRITVAHNHILNGLLGPTVLCTTNGGAFGTATVTTGSPTVTAVSGCPFVSTGLWSLQHMVLNGVDHQISSCASTTTCTLTANYADVQNFPAGGCGGGCTVAFTVYMVSASTAFQVCGGSTGNNTGVSATNGQTQVTLTNGTGDQACTFLAGMAPSFNININGVLYTVATFTNSTTIQLNTTYTGTTGTNITWSAYPTPTQHDTGAGECYQATAPVDGLIFVGNHAFACNDEAFTAGNGSFTAVGNQVENSGQGCIGCAAIIDSDQSGLTDEKGSVVIGPAVITGNVLKATSTFGVPTGGQTNYANNNGRMGVGVWINVSPPALGSCTVSNISVTGNVATPLFGGTVVVGFKYSNDSTLPCSTTLNNVYVAGNAWSPSCTVPVQILYANTTGSIELGYPDNGGANIIRKALASNQVFASVTPANVTAWSFTNLQPSTGYTLICDGLYSAVATGGLILTLSGPAAPTIVTQKYFQPTSASTANFQATTAAVFGGQVGVVVVTAATTFPFHFHASFQLGTTGGTVNVQAASVAAVNTTLYATSECDLLSN
jgi:hypothetical protein